MSLEGQLCCRGTGYTRIEDLLVCKSFMAASEDALTGTSQILCVQALHRFNQQYLLEQEKLDALQV
jgi:hypothetical protein